MALKVKWGGGISCKHICLSSSPGSFLPLHLLPVHFQKLIQLSEELGRWWAIILLSQDKPDSLSRRNCKQKELS